MKKTIIIISLIIFSVLIGYGYEKFAVYIEKANHPIKYEDIVVKYSKEHGVPQEIIYSVIKTESSFKSDAESPKGAIGLMQITPDTFDWLMTKLNESLSQGLLYDPETNIRYGTYFLKMLFMEFENWDLVFAAYNAGRSRVKNEWMKNPEYINNGEIIYIPFEETRNYIVKVNNSREIYRKLYFDGS